MALRVWLPLNGNLENQGLSNCAIVNNGATIDNNGKIGKTYLFNGNDDFISVDYPQSFNGKWTYCCWIYNDDSGGRSIFYGDFGLPNTGNISIEKTTAEKVRFYWNNGSPDVTFNNSLITVGAWTHLALTYDGEMVKVYINGAQTDSRSGALTTVIKTGLYYIGRDSRTGTTAFKGKMNDLRIYDECLSQKQIKEISKGLAANYLLKDIGANKNYIINSSFTGKTGNTIYSFDGDEVTFEATEFNQPNHTFGLSMDQSGRTDFKNKQITLSMEYKIETALVFGTTNPWVGFEMTITRNSETGGSSQWLDWYGSKSIPTAVTEGWIKYSRTVTVTDYDIANITIGFYLRDTKGKIKYRKPKVEIGTISTNWIPNESDIEYKILGFNKNFTTDSSGFGYNGTVYGTLKYNLDTPRYSGSTNFSTPGYIHYLPSPLNSATDAFTFTCWLYPTQKAAMALYNDRTVVGSGFSVFYLGGGIRFDTGQASETLAGSLTLNDWNFIACTWDKNNNIKKIYINGTQVGNTSSIGNLNEIGENASIGNSSVNAAGGAGNQVYGSISDIRIYCTALSAEDILTMYKTSGIIDNEGNVYSYEFKEE